MVRTSISTLLSAPLIAAAIVVSPISHAAEAWATISHQRVAQNEPFQLRITTDQRVSSDALDLSALEPDFDIGRPRFGTSINIINGKRSDRSEWTLTLSTDHIGTVNIPALSVKGIQTNPITLHITKDTQAPQLSDLIEVQATLDSDTLYPNESTTLSTRMVIKVDPRLIQNPQIQPPSVTGLEINPVGEMKQYASQQNGQAVTIVEQKYRLTADKAGEFSLTGPGFKGTAMYGGSMTYRAKQVRMNTEPQHFTITVQPKPADYTGTWLPTPTLALTQHWTNSDGKAIPSNTPYHTDVGESITRTITLDVAALSAEHFPNLQIDYPKSVRVYAEKPHFQTLKDGTARMTLKQVLIPQVAGEINVNGLSLNWWNSQKKQPQRSTLTGLTLQVASSDGLNSAPLSMPSSDTAPHKTEASPAATSTTADGSALWRYGTALFALLWGITLIMMFYFYRQTRTASASVLPPTVLASNTTATTAQIQQAFDRQEWIQAQHLIQQWLKSTPLSDEEYQHIQQALDEMNRARYSVTPSEWQPHALLKRLKKLEKQHGRSSKASPLAKL